MGQTSDGAKKAAETKRLLYGDDFHRRIGAMGGRKSRGGGFAALPRKQAQVAAHKSAQAKKKRRKSS